MYKIEAGLDSISAFYPYFCKCTKYKIRLKTRSWIRAFRLRTLPLSLSGIITAYFYFTYSSSTNKTLVFCLGLLTTILLQILSNLANDYGDGKKGTDNEDRIGPERGIQSGLISLKEMKIAIILFSLLSLFSGISLLLVAFSLDQLQSLLLFFLLGIFAIIASIKYTVGKTAYGYKAMGDLFVFIFFGLVGVAGFHLLLSQEINYEVLLLSFIIGSFSTMVLNLNNMRDTKNDMASNKITIPVILGFNKAKVYHYTLAFTLILSLVLFNISISNNLIWVNFTSILPILIHIRKVIQINQPKDFDPELKKIALSAFFFALLNSILLQLC